MKAIIDRLEWTKFYLTGVISEKNDMPGSPWYSTAIGIAKEELRMSIAIAEVLKVKELTDRLEAVRLYLIGSSSDKDLALDKLLEAMAIAEALPEITLVMPCDERLVVDLDKHKGFI